ncbi:MAG: hypothetical protein COV72_00215 [Candidatus Omnitrophica bacterium CG11_big_fil_rev_8_21_14_0_20_42_13]|uniref:SPOR domain-containing protein n=1 Tax=Candidatus Ghiorseimicrobium undicola TaxID=1974746 RepID=A0A2H0LZV9_9BACT|nr:MAG: hypothetical protein COV72_00215 [Candidatus Omnitrophica bacterium CG11_big_fil_rev_8_21_14_0_20_42_13]
MFGENKQTQLELFSSTAKDNEPRRAHSASLLEKIIAYERAIILGICFIVVFIIAYAMGIERGRLIAGAGINQLEPGKAAAIQDEPEINVSQAAHVETATREAALEQNVETLADKNIPEDKKYTVQVASFKSKDSAEKEKASLVKKGYQAYTLVKNKYIIVCVGRFEDREAAQSNQKQLRRIYGDCLIRTL